MNKAPFLPPINCCVCTNLTVSCRLLRRLPVVSLYDWARRGLILLGSHRGPLRSIAGDVRGAVFLGFTVGRVRLINLVFLGCCYPVRGAVLCNSKVWFAVSIVFVHVQRYLCSARVDTCCCRDAKQLIFSEDLHWKGSTVYHTQKHNLRNRTFHYPDAIS